jgi:hypothetical protein
VLLAVGGVWWAMNDIGGDVASSRHAVALVEPSLEPVRPMVIVVSRAPTALELTLVAAIDRQSVRAAAAAVSQPPVAHAALAAPAMVPEPAAIPPPPDPYAEMLAEGTPAAVDRLLERVADPATADAALAAVAAFPTPPTDALVARLAAPRVDIRGAAARALGRVDDPAVARRLAAMAAADIHPREALAALASSDQPDAARFFALARESDALGAAARSALAQYGDP